FDTMNGAFLKTETEVGCESALLLPSSAGENLQVICPSENDRTPALIRFLHLTSEPATSTVLALPNGKVPNTQITPALQGGGIGLWNVRTGTLSPDESTLTIFKGDGTALEIDVATRTQKRALTEVYMTDRWVPSRPAVYSHDGTRVYVAIGRLATRTTGQAEEIFVFDARTGRQITTIKTSIPFESLAISNDDRYLYAPSHD